MAYGTGRDFLLAITMTILEQIVTCKGRVLIATSLGTDSPASATLPAEDAAFLGHPRPHFSPEPTVFYPSL